MSFTRIFRLFSVSIGMVALAIIASCTSSGTSDVLESAVSDKKPATEIQDLRAFCPKITLRAGTETLRAYKKGVKKDDEDASKSLKFQATINEAVRECNYIAETLSMRVGVAGRVITGPIGGPGNIELPIRIAVTKGNSTLYSQLHKIQATIESGRAIARFRFVDENLVIDKPDSRNVTIHVGFDEGPYNTP